MVLPVNAPEAGNTGGNPPETPQPQLPQANPENHPTQGLRGRAANIAEATREGWRAGIQRAREVAGVNNNTNQPDNAPAQQQAPVEAPAPQQREEMTPRQRDIALERVRNRIDVVQRRINTLPHEHTGRFTQPEAQILNGYVERVRSQVDNPNLGFGNRSARELADNFNNSGHAAQFRTPDNARAEILEIGRRGVQLENARQRVELRETQERAVRHLRDELLYLRDRANVNRMVNGLHGVGAELTQEQLAGRRTRDEWNRVIGNEREILQQAVLENRITQQEFDNYISLRQLQRDSLSSTDERGNVRRESDLVNPASLPAYRRFNNMNDQGSALQGGKLFDRIQRDIIGPENQINISAQDLRAIRRSLNDSGYDITWRDEDGRNQREDLDVQGTGARRVTREYENAHLATMLNRIVSMMDGINTQVTEQGYGLDDETVYKIGVTTPDVALAELSNVHEYLTDTALPEANNRLDEEQLKFNDLGGDIELSADPNIRTQLQQELAQLQAREGELSGRGAPAGGQTQEQQQVNPELEALRREVEELRRQAAEREQNNQNRRNRWKRIAAFAAGAVVGVALVASAIPVATVAGLAAISGGASILSGLANRFFVRGAISRLQNSPVARENMTEEERQRRIGNYQRLSNALDYFRLFTTGFAITAGVGSMIEGWLNSSTAGATTSADKMATEPGSGTTGTEGGGIPTSGGSETIAVPGDSQWSMIDKTLRSAYPNMTGDQISNATGNILQQAGPGKVYEVVFSHRGPDIVGGAIQVGDKLTIADLNQIAPNVLQSLGPRVGLP